MQSSSGNALKRLSRGANSFHNNRIRHVSLTGAIEKGIRHAQRAVDGKGRRSEVTDQADGRKGEQRDVNQRWSKSRLDVLGRRRPAEGLETDMVPERRPSAVVRTSNPGPVAIPYTQADSEFLYGTFAVKAAIAARRRTLHKLYVYVPEDRKYISPQEIEDDARAARVDVKRVSGPSWLHLFEKMSQGRPHNSYLLEASPLPIQNVLGGLRPVLGASTLSAEFAPNGDNFLAEESHDSTSILRRHFPFYLMLDLILDPGNLGAIIRSAYFFGVDGVILPEHNTAPLTGVAVKASAGAAEYLPLLRIKNEIAFIQKSRANGWRFYGAAAMEPDTSPDRNAVPRDDEVPVADALSRSPTVLVLGGEAEGIRPRIARALDQTISIGTSASHPGIDSLNVSVAASILIRDFLHPHSSGSQFKE